MPPAAAKRLAERGGIGETVGFGLNQAEPGLLIGLIGVEHRQISGISVLVLEAGEIEARLRGVRRFRRRVQRIGILLERDERVGDVLERREHGAAILLGALLIGVAGGALLMQPRSAVEDRR